MAAAADPAAAVEAARAAIEIADGAGDEDHGAVRRDGAVSGYRWGVERKRALLEREALPA